MMLIAVIGAFFSLSAAHAATYCLATIEDAKDGVIGHGDHKEVRWSTYDKKVWNEIKLTNREKVRFTLETIMTHPDSGIETVTIEGHKIEACTTRFVYAGESDGGGAIGEATSCQESESRFVTVLCINESK